VHTNKDGYNSQPKKIFIKKNETKSIAMKRAKNVEVKYFDKIVAIKLKIIF